MVESVTSSSLVSSTTTESSESRNQLASDLDSFLTLLTTQLQAQDPLSPMDSTEFTNQLVLFAQVEQQINQNENLEALLDANIKTQQAIAIGYLGNYVEVETNTVMLQDSEAVFTYGLSGDVQKVSVNVLDTDGNLVRTFQGDPLSGLHKLTWDGTDYNGDLVDDGVYVLDVTITEQDDSDTEVETWTTSLGMVTGVATDDDVTYLAIGDMSVDMDNVLGVFYELPLDDVEGGDDTSSDDDTTTTDDDTSTDDDDDTETT